jgi:hypothetical protein
MLYAVVDKDGTPIPITRTDPPTPFATTQLRVKEGEAEHYGFKPGEIAAGEIIWQPLIHAAGAMELWAPEDFDRFQVHQLDDPHVPTDRVLVRYVWVNDGENITVAAEHAAPPVPETVPRVLFLMELHDRPAPADETRTMLDVVDAAVEASGKRVLIAYWSGMVEFARLSPKFIEIMEEAKFGADLIDELFIACLKQF